MGTDGIVAAICGAAFVQVVAFSVGYGKMQQKLKNVSDEVKFIKRYLFDGHSTDK